MLNWRIKPVRNWGYIITARAMPLLNLIAEAGVDVLIGVDPGGL